MDPLLPTFVAGFHFACMFKHNALNGGGLHPDAVILALYYTQGMIYQDKMNTFIQTITNNIFT